MVSVSRQGQLFDDVVFPRTACPRKPRFREGPASSAVSSKRVPRRQAQGLDDQVAEHIGSLYIRPGAGELL